MAAPTQPELSHNPIDVDLNNQRQFKKRKPLPRPRNDRIADDSRSLRAVYDLLLDTSAPGLEDSQASSPRTLKHQPRRIGTGPDLPPTPPNYSRASSGSYPAQPSSPSASGIIVHPPKTSSKRPPATPPDQRSPPTPDVTPPQPASRPRALRPSTLDRGSSRTATTTTNSRTESVKTTREEPLSEEDEAAMLNAKAVVISPPPSQSTVFRGSRSTSGHTIKPQALDLALERLTAKHDEGYTPGSRRELAEFDGGWGSFNQVEQECGDNLERLVSAGRHRPKPVPPKTPWVTEGKKAVKEDNTPPPTMATRTVRSVSLQETSTVRPSPKRTSHKKPQGLDMTLSGTTENLESRNSSGLSCDPTPPTIMGTILVGNQPRQRQRTLRHVRKRRELRETSPRGRRVVTDVLELQPSTWSSSSSQYDRGRRHDGYASTTGTKAMISGRASREVWKNGGIPVVVVPDRRSSQKSKSREPSLRSTSSRHSRNRSVGSSPLDRSPLPGEDLSLERQSRWDRSTSVSDRSKQRTIDFPPTIPARSSSMSAPTSRTISRAGSLTAESLQALNDANDQPTKALLSKTTPATPQMTSVAIPALPEPPIPTSPCAAGRSPQTPKTEGQGVAAEHLSPDHHDDEASTRKYSSRTTPFSIVSVETNWTALEVSEAQAVHMYPHQNSSVLMVDHSAKPSDASDTPAKGFMADESIEHPKITATCPEGGLVTPEQRQSLEEVDSPLRNPRAPPDPPALPPAINFIPATPSGLTPAAAKTQQTAGIHEAGTEKPERRSSIVRRVLSRRRHSLSYPPNSSKQPGFITRAFSSSRSTGRSFESQRPRSINTGIGLSYGAIEDEPVEQDKLHPHWRPQWDNEEFCDCAECRHMGEVDETTYRYPLVDNRPRLPKRSLSTKMKQTFAILPTRAETKYLADDNDGPQRRTVQRTPSGNLKVVRRRASSESLKQYLRTREDRRPMSESNSQKNFWRGYSLRKRSSHVKLRRSSSLSSRIEGIPSLTRMWNERRREKRTQELRQMISGPREVRDGVGDVIRKSNIKGLQSYPDQI
ncbi:hypothetical protein ED733_003999 [Metarhizium rileyi]|uniref:Uncharacterized protein n=1 Tax=Metarhizium rileyi (strain RCEF 4871) TaxID=1649241 RepID=A0A5C6G991_METRR|nr:hypothetical protein ED733_003999 [Metarhizium rileyi]